MESDFTRLEERMLARFGIAATARFVNAGRGRARALVAGQGPPVVLVPGGGMPAAAWAPLMAELEGFRLYALDLPGFGLADRLPLGEGNLRARAPSFLEATLDGLGLERSAFVANSMGALWSFWLALDRPERVASIVAVGCPALIAGTSAPLPMRLMSVPPIGRLMMKLQPPSAKQVNRALARIGTDLSTLPELRDLVVAMERLPSCGTAWLELLHAALRLRGARPEVALTPDQLSRVAQPVQLIWGEDDPFGSPTAGRRAAGMLPDAEFHLMRGGHHPFLPEAAGIAQFVIDFLRRHAVDQAPRSRTASGHSSDEEAD